MLISEIFYSMQGEGTRRGRPCAFVRLTGCPLRCRWCDSAFAFHGGEELSSGEILERVRRFPTSLVCVTGGEPLAQGEVHELLSLLADGGYTVLLETSGALDIAPVDARVIRIMDWKAPGSGESQRNLASNVAALRGMDELKFVLRDRGDYEWAREEMERHGFVDRVARVLMSPVHGELSSTRLAEWILQDGLDVTLQFQEHKLLWPGVERGV